MITHKPFVLSHREVLQQVKETGGRFLKKIDYKADIWVEVSNAHAREKVCQVSSCLCKDTILTVS